MIASAELPTAAAPDARPFGVIEAEQRFVIDNLTWGQYEAIDEAIGPRSGVRLTYDRGRLELMSLSPEHGRLSRLFTHLIGVLIEECNLVGGAFGDTTFKLELAERGLQPDECFYAANYPTVCDKDRLDLNVDPPPDLAIEVDVASSSFSRMGIYAALKVPEVWRWVGGAIRVYHLTAAGGYDESDVSTAFLPGFPVNELLPFLTIGRGRGGDGAVLRAFREWVRGWAADRGLLA